MSYPFPMKEIAFQAGLSLATIDRVLNDRPGVRATTKARVAAALRELERQYGASGLAGRRVSFDVVIEAPERFSRAVRRAFEAELPLLRPANVTLRFHLTERWEEADLCHLLALIRRRGSHGVILKAPASPAIGSAAERLHSSGIPVCTFVTDQAGAARTAYIGIDNRKAGATAAGLMAPMLAGTDAEVLITLSSARFSGEAERADGFEAEMSALAPGRAVHRVAEGMGLDPGTAALVEAQLAAHPGIGAVYSVGGANRAVLAAFEAAGRPCRVFAGHDLDRANRDLLGARKLTFVIDHDLRQDARQAFQTLLAHHRMLPEAEAPTPSRFTVVTPQSL
ncbi:MAG: LacI family DNA-binding transcriptional regulator [Silicimonas sp.]|nr:LacI family DNA-binding transcriptional regulator [Silicimonas sp.]